MKRIELRKVMELLISLKNRYSELIEDKNYMLSEYQFDCCEDEFEFDCVCDEIEETEKAIDDIYDIIYGDDTIICDDVLYYNGECNNDEIKYDIFS